MCLYVESDVLKTTSPKICYKSGCVRFPIFGKFKSSHRNNFTYSRFKVQDRIDVSIDKYTNRIERGFHSWKSGINGDHLGIQLFIIPSNCNYYKGMQFDGSQGYVSESIVWIGSIFNPVTWITVLLIKTGVIKFKI